MKIIRNLYPIEENLESFIKAVRDYEEILISFMTKKEEADIELAKELRKSGLITTLGEPF